MARHTAIAEAIASHTDDCILWQFSKTDKGYARTSVGSNTNVKAHRLVFAAVHGSSPPVVRHTCDVRHCINPRHLLPGTQADNMRDMAERQRSQRFNDLTPDQVAEIKSLRGLVTQVEIARRFGIKQARVSRIQLGKY